MKTVEWKFITKSTGRKGVSYFVSNTGLVKTVTKHGVTRISKGADNGTGHLFCTLGFIHRLVAQAFIPNPDNKPFIDHIDGNPRNNNVENLRWVTAKENSNNPVTKQRRYDYFDKTYGKKHKLMHDVIWWQQIDDNGSVIKEWESSSDAAKSLGTTRQNIWNAANGNGKAAGYKWKKILKKTVLFARSF